MERRVGFGEFCLDTPQLAAGSFIMGKSTANLAILALSKS